MYGMEMGCLLTFLKHFSGASSVCARAPLYPREKAGKLTWLEFISAGVLMTLLETVILYYALEPRWLS